MLDFFSSFASESSEYVKISKPSEQSTQGIEVGYNNLNEVGSWNAQRDITLIGPNKRAERGWLSLFGYHLTVQHLREMLLFFVRDHW